MMGNKSVIAHLKANSKRKPENCSPTFPTDLWIAT